MNRTSTLSDSSESRLFSSSINFDWPTNRLTPASEGLPLAETAMPDSAECLFSPIHYQEGYAYPLIVWMHEDDSNEEELCRAMPHISVRNYVAVSPRGTQKSKRVSSGFCWGQNEQDLAEASSRALDAVEIAREKYNVHPERIFIAGHAAGGTMALRVAMENPSVFAAAISLGGRVPRGSRPLRHINQARKLPLMISVSPEEEGYSDEQVMEDLRLLHIGGFQLSLQLYPAGDGLTTTMLSDLNEWIMQSINSESTVCF